MNTLQAIIIAFIEGLTEYLPISSTAHMIFTGAIFQIDQEDSFVKLYELCIQFGAILAVVVLYWRKFFDFKKIKFYLKLAVGVVPALILGMIFNKKIESLLENPIPISIVLILGGVILIFVDKWFKNPIIVKEEQISIKNALIIGFWQCLAMIPGTSRSAASIIGGMQQKLSREVAAEFSFFLAVPTMLAVTVYSLFLKSWGDDGIKGYQLVAENSEKMGIFVMGNVIAFIVAILAIKFFVEIIKKYGFKVWGWYRVIVGICLLIYFLRDVNF